ncbi:MAG: tRNA (N6-isopentenyl adenosine(37)-C2)-methylthiotransferase MiaB [Actinomycetota bacterium]|nr:tRNA (N6-isopentenyl adenosine(37)-C2)-methylthiotransferase MiaB [Actinomycetota bacterium]
MTKRYSIQTFGCQMNEHDSERISGLLETAGLERVLEPESADVVVLNTCCIRENADNKFYGHLGNLKSLKEQNPSMKIMVGGCLAQKDQEAIRDRASHVDVVFGTHNLERVVDLLEESDHGPIVEIIEPTENELDSFGSEPLPTRRDVAYAAWMTIQSGCDNACAFCIVPQVRGPEVSKPFGDLLQEAKNLVNDGVDEITLLGQNVNSYGRDLTLKLRFQPPSELDETIAGYEWANNIKRTPRPLFGDLLRGIGDIPGLRRVRYTSPHPKDLRDDVMHAMAETESICEHLHFPLQSGSDRILSAMHRGYTAERYLKKLEQARLIIPDLAVTTDIIVGFPGETDHDFEETLNVAAQAEFDSAFTFVFSPRPGTEAAEMVQEYCDPKVVVERYERLRAVIQRSGMIKHQERIGKEEKVIIEGISKKDPTLLSGRTRQNKLVHFPASHLPDGTLAIAKVTSAAPNYLMGELVEVLERPRRKTRIPVVAG